MLATVQAVKSSEEEGRRKAYTRDKWKQPVDWRIVTEKTSHQYIPFEENNINQTIAINYMQSEQSRKNAVFTANWPAHPAISVLLITVSDNDF